MSENPSQLPIGEILWQPSPEKIAKSQICQFIENLDVDINDQTQVDTEIVGDDHFQRLYQWSIDHPEKFWSEVWQQFDIVSSRNWDDVLVDAHLMPGAKWFAGAKLNYAENLLRYRDDRVAIVFRGEHGVKRSITYKELYSEVAKFADLLSRLGVKEGDRVAGYMSNNPETIFALLATASMGAIWSSCSPDFGVKGVLERFSLIQPKVLFAIDAYQYNGRQHDVLADTREVVNQLSSIEKVIIVPFIEDCPKIDHIKNAMLLSDFESEATDVSFTQLPFDHPLYILYSSGTTGTPKCIVHSAGGSLLQHIKEHRLHCDLDRDDTLFYFTTCGWMMWNWLVTGLATGCTLLLYDGSPFYPKRKSMWQLAAEEKISVFGTSARFLSASSKAKLKPIDEFDLSSLRAILSTGSPLAPETFDYVYEQINPDVMLSSISGGTDIVSCFVLGNPTGPVRRGEIQCRGLGMAVDVYVDGESVRQQRGELVCTKPFPSMPIGFWGEKDDSRYQDAYFSRFENIWAQGDYAEITKNNGMVIYGRSDAVLNPGGIRIGTAEIYRQVEKVDEVLESICIGQIWENDVRIVLFVMLREGVELDDSLRLRIRNVIKENTTTRHVPRKIIAVADIPRTLSGKIVELAVRNVVHGDPVKNTEALANPEALKHFENIAELSQK